MRKFSVAIPAYKTKFLKAAIQSVLRQSFGDFELIILNDCSPEPVGEIVREFADSRIRYCENDTNVGVIDVVDNWNKCLDLANGEFFMCMGDDDELEEGCLEEYDRLIKLYPHQNVFHGQTIVIDENGESLFAPLSRPELESAYELAYYRVFGRKQYVGDFLYNTAALKHAGGYYKLPAAWGSDDITAIRAAKETGIVNTHRIVFRYRQNPYSISSSGLTDVKLEAITSEEAWYHSLLAEKPANDAFDERYPVLLGNECAKFFQKKRLRLIADDMMICPLHLLTWLRRHKEISLSRKMVIYAFIVSIRDRESIKYQKAERDNA